MEKKRTGKAKRLLHLLWIVPLLIVLTFAALMYVVPAFENVDRTAVQGSQDWMLKLDDGLPLSEVVLPGTHDSATQNVQFAFIARCQALSIGEQLEAGFRYLDIRLAVSRGSLVMVHGFANCTTSGWPWAGTLSFDNVLSETYAFLKAHPSETVVFAVKQDHGSETPEQFEAALKNVIDRDPDLWLLTDRIPTVGESRGKIVLLQHYENPEDPDPTIGVKCFWEKQNKHDDVSKNVAVHDEGNFTLYVQDRYEYGIGDKRNAFWEGMNKAETGPDALSINFLSTKGTTAYGHPYGLAKQLNAELLSSADTLKGWVIVDFGSAALAQRIYETNFPQN